MTFKAMVMCVTLLAAVPAPAAALPSHPCVDGAAAHVRVTVEVHSNGTLYGAYAGLRRSVESKLADLKRIVLKIRFLPAPQPTIESSRGLPPAAPAPQSAAV